MMTRRPLDKAQVEEVETAMKALMAAVVKAPRREAAEGMANALRFEHNTNQQTFGGRLAEALDAYAVDRFTDLRNEAFKEWCRRACANDFNFPYV